MSFQALRKFFGLDGKVFFAPRSAAPSSERTIRSESS
jgi:hypothetical protein